MVKGFLRQHESAPVHGHRLAGTQIVHQLQRLRRVHVHGFHEVTRQVGANRQCQKIDSAQACPDGAEITAVAGVTGEQKAPWLPWSIVPLQEITAPQ